MPIISSRTPEGEPIDCSHCGKPSLVVPSIFPIHDVPCPNCGMLLILSGGQTTRQDIEEMLASIGRGAERLAELHHESQTTDPIQIELAVQEVTDSVQIRLLEMLES